MVCVCLVSTLSYFENGIQPETFGMATTTKMIALLKEEREKKSRTDDSYSRNNKTREGKKKIF